MNRGAHLTGTFSKPKNYEELVVHKWHLAGLLHDADWDQWPGQHCRKILGELENRSIDPDIIRAIAFHGRAILEWSPFRRRIRCSMTLMNWAGLSMPVL